MASSAPLFDPVHMHVDVHLQPVALQQSADKLPGIIQRGLRATLWLSHRADFRLLNRVQNQEWHRREPHSNH